MSETVVQAVAAVTGSDPLAMDPIHDVVDPDSLDGLFAAKRDGPGHHVAFTYCNCDIVVSADGTVQVSPPDRESSGAQAVSHP